MLAVAAADPASSPCLPPAGAQCAHAATGVVQSYQSKMAVPFRQWEMMGQAKIALKCNTSEELVRSLTAGL